MTIEEEYAQLKEDFERDPQKWHGIPFEAALLYVADQVKNPDDIRSYMRRHIPPEEAGNDFLGLPQTLEEKFKMMGI